RACLLRGPAGAVLGARASHGRGGLPQHRGTVQSDHRAGIRDAAFLDVRAPARVSRYLVAPQALPGRARKGRAGARVSASARGVGGPRRAPRPLAAFGTRLPLVMRRAAVGLTLTGGTRRAP